MVLPGGAAEARRSPVCKKKGGKTLLVTREARVFRKQGQVYACLSRKRRAFRLGGRSELGLLDEVSNFRLAGRYVAYSRHESRGLRVTVRELRRGRAVRDAKAAVVSRRPFGFLTDIKLRRNGSVAWIVTAQPLDGPLNPNPMPTDYLPDYEVGKAERGGQTLLDMGHYIAAGSLALRGTTISWTNGSRRRSASLN